MIVFDRTQLLRVKTVTLSMDMVLELLSPRDRTYRVVGLPADARARAGGADRQRHLLTLLIESSEFEEVEAHIIPPELEVRAVYDSEA